MNITDKLLNILSQQQVIFGDALKDNYYHIWKMDEPLNALAMVFPKTTEEISRILELCNNHKQAVIVFGGRTNLVGSTETMGNEILISMEKMNQIIELDQSSRTMTVEAGVLLETIQNKASENDFLFPLNFGAKGSAQIGGIISTNAGGLRVLKYGMTRNPDGTILSSLKKIIKDNSAYDLKQLFVGSEGTLGVVTKAVLKLRETPTSRNSAFIGINTFDNVVAFLKYIDKKLAGLLSGYELIWADTYAQMTNDETGSKPPLEPKYKYYVLVESLGSQQEKERNNLIDIIEQALEKKLVEDAVVAYTKSDLDWFWKLREDVHVIASSCTYDQHFDISLPIPTIGTVLDDININLRQLDGVNHSYTFGHIADGNIHIIVDKDSDDELLKNKINDIVYSPLQALGGSVSAEHGIGLHKKPYLHLCRTEAEIFLMKKLKRTLDPNNILNPNKVIDINE